MNRTHDIADIARGKISDIFPLESRQESVAKVTAICAGALLREFSDKLTPPEIAALESALSKWRRVVAIQATAEDLSRRVLMGETVNINEGWPE